MKKPVRNKPDYMVDRQGTRWKSDCYDLTWEGQDNFGTFYNRSLYNPPTKLTGIWDQ